MKMKRILVPTDFSPGAFKAIGYAAEIAGITGAVVNLLHVIEPSLNMTTMQTDSLRKKAVSEGRKKLLTAILSAKKVYPNLKITPHLSGGKTVESIVSFADQRKTELIVMGTTGAGNDIKKHLFGSVATGTISASKVPVLSVPATHDAAKPQRMVFATNRFETDKRLLESMMTLPALFSAEVHVVVYNADLPSEDGNTVRMTDELAKYYLFLSGTFPEISFKKRLLSGDDFEEALNDYCDKINADVVSMIAYPKSAIKKLLKTSAIRKMALYSTLPLLVIPVVRKKENDTVISPTKIKKR